MKKKTLDILNPETLTKSASIATYKADCVIHSCGFPVKSKTPYRERRIQTKSFARVKNASGGSRRDPRTKENFREGITFETYGQVGVELSSAHLGSTSRHGEAWKQMLTSEIVNATGKERGRREREK